MIMRKLYLTVYISISKINKQYIFNIFLLDLVNTYFDTPENEDFHSRLLFVCTLNEFKCNLAARFSSTIWLNTIDFSKFVIIGGCVVNALCQFPFSDTKEQDVNLVYISKNSETFEDAFKTTVDKLKKVFWTNSMSEITIERILGTCSYNVFLPCHVRLNFAEKFVGNSANGLSYILHSLDTDISQVAFIGRPR